MILDLPGSASGRLQRLKSHLLPDDAIFASACFRMADSTRSSLAKIIGYIWTLVLAFFVGQTTSARSELPLDATRGRAEVQQSLRSSKYMIKKEKEQFLRHPSLRSKCKGRQKNTNTESCSKQYRSPSIFPSGSSMHHLNSFVHRPWAGSSAIPVVVITPSTPTRDMFPVAELPPEPPDATQFVLEGPNEVPLALEKQVSVPPDVEDDISDIEFDSWIIPAPQASLGGKAVEPSFFLPESLQKITFEPIRCASHTLSAVSNILYDDPVWSSVEAPDVGTPAYFTSTPPRRRRSVRRKLRDIENNYVEVISTLDSSGDNGFYQYVDLIPYPDVFDLDMYYDVTMPLRKTLKKPTSRDSTFRNTLSLESDGLTDPPPCARLHSDCCKERSRIAPVTYHERERDSKTRRDHIHHSLSTRSILENSNSSTLLLSSILPQSQQQHQIPRHNPSSSRYIRPLDESTNTFFRTSTTSTMTSPSASLYSIEKSTATCVKSQPEIIRSVPASTDSQGSRSCSQRSRTAPDSEPESDVGSMNAVNARLKEACDSYSTPTFMEEIEIWEPVYF